MTTVSDYIDSLDGDDFTFRRLTNKLLSGELGREVEGMAGAVVRDEDPLDLIDLDQLLRNVQRKFNGDARHS
jgi:hypothetical protein